MCGRCGKSTTAAEGTSLCAHKRASRTGPHAAKPYTKFLFPTHARLQKMVTRFVRACDVCQRINANHQHKAVLQPIAPPTEMGECISLDFLELPLSTRGNDYMLVTVDKLSKMVKVAATKKTITSEESAELLLALTIGTYGRLPTSLISDRDTRFTAEVWQRTWQLLGTTLKMTTAKRPQADGQTERLNRQILEYLRKYCNSLGSDWDSPATLAMMEFALNSHQSTTTDSSPLQLLLGREPKQPLLMTDQSPQATTALPLETRLRVARDASLLAQERMVGTDKLPNQVIFAAGDKVLLDTRNYPQLRDKLANRFIGPFVVDKVLGPTVMQLKLPASYQIHPSINTEFLKKYVTGENEQPAPPPPILDKQGREEFVVEKIVGERQRAGKTQFKVHWRGYGAEHDSWEPHSHCMCGN